MSFEFLESTIDKFVLKVKMSLRYSKDHVWVKEEDPHCILSLIDYGQRKGGALHQQ